MDSFNYTETIKETVEKYAKEVQEEKVSVSEALETLPLNPKTFEDAMDSVYLSMRNIMVSKQKLRGPSNIDNQGLLGVVTRMKEDKLERIMKSVKGQATRQMLIDDGMPLDIVDQYYPSIEESEGDAEDSLADDLLDVANYAIICLMVMWDIWGLPVGVELQEE